MLSMRWNRFRVCSACDAVSSQYAQCAIKFVPRMLSMDCTRNNVHILPLAEHAPSMLSMRWNRFRVCSACDKIVSAYAQHMHAIIFENDSKMQISPIKNQNFEKPSRNPSNWTKVKIYRKKFLDISQKKFGSAYAQSPRKCSNIEILAKSKEKKRNFFRKFTKGILYKDLI